SFDRLRMRNAILIHPESPHPLMSIFSRVVHDFFSFHFCRGMFLACMGRRDGLGAGIEVDG
ncbi:MAG: hypothetical protein V3S44_05785, partial [Alphaproteobacteria bacterium]